MASQGELARHADFCGLGEGAFLIINMSAVVLMHDGYAIEYGSVYVDDHGEMDIGLRRGQYVLETVGSNYTVAVSNATMLLSCVCLSTDRCIWITHGSNI